MRFRIQSFKPGKTEGLLGKKYAIIERKRKIISENETGPIEIRKDRELRPDLENHNLDINKKSRNRNPKSERSRSKKPDIHEIPELQ